MTYSNTMEGASKKNKNEIEGFSHFCYESQATFLKCAIAQERKEVVVAGIPYDGATTNRPGARHGPKQMREMSHLLCDGVHDLFNTSPLLESFGDVGDISLPNTSITEMRKALHPKVLQLLSTHGHCVWLGGDHSVTLPILRAYKEHFKEPLAVIHFDAHCDAWKDHFGEPSGHGTWVYEAFEEKLVVPELFTQIGIRSSGEREAREFVSGKGGKIFTARDLRGLHNEVQLKDILDNIIARHAKHPNTPVYLTLDIDCLDPCYAPATGTPEIGGMTSTQVLTIIESLVPKLNMVGMDCVEVSPPFDSTANITSQAGACFVHTYLCAIFAKKKLQENKK